MLNKSTDIVKPKKCQHIIPFVMKEIVKDLLYLDIIDMRNNSEKLKTLELIEESKHISSYDSHKNENTNAIKYHISYSWSETENVILHKKTIHNIHDLNIDLMEFLLSINHKVMYLQDETFYKKYLWSILNRHGDNKSIVLLNNKLYLSNAKYLRSVKLKRVRCQNPIFRKISEILVSFPQNNLDKIYKDVISIEDLSKISREPEREMRIDMYLRKLYAYKKNYDTSM